MTEKIELKGTIKEKNNIQGSVNGYAGPQGISPTATVTENEQGALIKITDINGTTTAQIYNGVTMEQVNEAIQNAIAEMNQN